MPLCHVCETKVVRCACCFTVTPWSVKKKKIDQLILYVLFGWKKPRGAESYAEGVLPTPPLHMYSPHTDHTDKRVLWSMDLVVDPTHGLK